MRRSRPKRGAATNQGLLQGTSPGSSVPVQAPVLTHVPDKVEPSTVVTAAPAQNVQSPPDSESRGIAIGPLSANTPSTVIASATVRPLLAGRTAPPGDADLAASTPFDVHTLQGIQLHLDHSDIKAASPTTHCSPTLFAVSAEEETLVQHYARRLAKWVRNVHV